MATNELLKEFKDWLIKNYPNGIEIYPDYNDWLKPEIAQEIIEAENPMYTLNEQMWTIYDDIQSDLQMDAVLEFKKEKNIDDDDNYPVDMLEVVEENLDTVYPEEHFLNQEFDVDIFIDTGDFDFDHSCNQIYPHYDAAEDEKLQDIQKENCLLWLAKKQGYSKKQFYNFMHKGILPNNQGSPLLKSIYEELENCSTSMNGLVIFRKMTLKELIEMNKSEEPVHIRKNLKAGLLDRCNGSGGLLDITLEKDFDIPRENIKWIIIDDVVGPYSVDDIYGDDSMYHRG